MALANRPDEPAALPELVEEHLPFYSESSVRFRELVHDRTTDLSWSWRRVGRSLLFQMRGSASPLLASVKPPFVEWPDDGTVLVQLFWLIGALVIVGTVLWVVRFVMHKVFIVDVIEPLWSGSAESFKDSGGSHLFLVGAESPSQTLPATYCEINLADAPEADQAEDRWFDEQVERLGQSPAGQSVLIRHFERRLQNRRFNERKLALVERIVTVLNRSIAIVSMAPPGHFFTSVPVGSGSEVAGDWSRRWAEVLSRFVVIPVNAVGPEPEAALPGAEVLSNWTTGGWREIVWRLNALGFAHSSRFLDDERREPQVDRFWREILPYAWHPGRPALDLRQLLIEVGDRAESYYAEIWATCTPAEKLVLSQIGQEGLANERTKRTIRLLMARGLVRRQPNFALMTETFRQFVLSSKAEVEALEGQFSSAWDRIRWPFLTVLIVGAVFFYVTRKRSVQHGARSTDGNGYCRSRRRQDGRTVWRAPFGLTRCGQGLRQSNHRSSILKSSMETRGCYDIGRRQSALMEGRSDERAIASGFCEASEIIQAPDAPACDQGEPWDGLAHAGDRTEVGTLLETDTGQINHADVAGTRSRGACGQTARRLVGYALFVCRRTHGDRHAAPQVQAERHALSADRNADCFERVERWERLEPDHDRRGAKSECLTRAGNRRRPRVEPKRRAEPRQTCDEAILEALRDCREAVIIASRSAT